MSSGDCLGHTLVWGIPWSWLTQTCRSLILDQFTKPSHFKHLLPSESLVCSASVRECLSYLHLNLLRLWLIVKRFHEQKRQRLMEAGRTATTASKD